MAIGMDNRAKQLIDLLLLSDPGTGYPALKRTSRSQLASLHVLVREMNTQVKSTSSSGKG